MTNDIKQCFERCEKKYFLTPLQQQELLERMRPFIKADKHAKYTICNIYYDTDDWRLIRASIEKPVYKEKLRLRSYGIPAPNDTAFAELKKKCAGIVYKRRITANIHLLETFLQGQTTRQDFGQIGREIAWFQRLYQAKPKVFIAYDRQAFAGADDPELRVTFDSNMRWRDTDLNLCLGDYGAPILPPDKENNILMEIKIPAACPLWLSQLLSEAGIFSASFSKYGFCYREHILKNKLQKYKEEVWLCA